jgi:hypothetical protein
MVIRGSTAAAMAFANAIKASGVLVQIKPDEFQALLKRIDNPLIICSEGGLFSTTYKYLTSYKGFAFYTQSSVPIILPLGIETVVSKKIWLPE